MYTWFKINDTATFVYNYTRPDDAFVPAYIVTLRSEMISSDVKYCMVHNLRDEFPVHYKIMDQLAGAFARSSGLVPVSGTSYGYLHTSDVPKDILKN